MQQGIIEPTAFDEARDRAAAGEGMEGAILVAMDVLDEEELSDALSSQAEEKLFETFEWRSGSFRFEVGKRLKKANSLALDRSPASVILEGVRTRYPLDRIDQYLEANSECFLSRAEDPFKKLQEIELDATERAMLIEQMPAQLRVRDLAKGDEIGRRALFGLIATGLVEVGEAPAAPAAPGSEGNEAPSAARPTAPRGADISESVLPNDDDRTLRAELAATAEQLRQQNYFEMLEVDRNCDLDALGAAFEQRAQRFHPDRFAQTSSAVRQLADEVFQHLQRAYETLADPKRAQSYVLELERGEREAKQEEAGRRALEAEVEFQRGEGLMRKRSYEAALICFGNALQKAPEEGEYHAYYGWCLHLCHPDESAMVEEAIEHVGRGLKLARDREKPFLFLGRLYKVTGRMNAAEKMFTRAVQVAPNSVEALRELRLITIRRKRRARA